MSEVAERQSRQFRQTFSANLNLLLNRFGCKASGFGRVREVALLFDMSTTSAQNWLTGSSLPEMSKLPEICAKINCTLSELFHGLTSEDPNKRVEIGDVGMRRIRVLSNTNEKALFISPELFGTSPWGDDTSIFQVDDNMMEPFVVQGEYVLFDKSFDVDHLSGVYLLLNNGRYIVRRLQETMQQTVKLICENKRYAPEEIPADRFRVDGPKLALLETNFVSIVGRVTGRVLHR